MVFFRPSKRFVGWLIKQADGRIIYDVGCGDAYLLRRLLERGAKALGIEPWWDTLDGYDPRLPVLPLKAQECSALREHPGLVVFARPCHSGFVEDTVDTVHPDSEILYITVPANYDNEIDLDKSTLKELPAPTCVDGEKVYRVLRNNKREQKTTKETKKCVSGHRSWKRPGAVTV